MTTKDRDTTVRGRIRAAWLTTIKHTLNHLTLRVAKSKHGPWAVMRHVGRTSGKIYETPIVIAPSPQGLVAQLTYGPQVSWYKNIVAAGHCTVVQHGKTYQVDRITPMATADGLLAYGPPRSWVLRLLRKHEFLALHVEGYPSASTDDLTPVVSSD